MGELDNTTFIPMKDAKVDLQTVPGRSTSRNMRSPLLESDRTTENNTLLAYLDQMDGLISKIRSQMSHNY